jgi:hypothetical protein
MMASMPSLIFKSRAENLSRGLALIVPYSINW